MENECEYVSSHGLLKSSNFYRLNSYTKQNNNDEHILNNIENYDTLYIPASNLNFFANIYLNKLNVKIILITGDDDDIIPHKFPEETKAILESPNIIHWFAQNCLINHSKIIFCFFV